VIVLDSAGYGPVTITKSVSIIAPAGIYAGISVFSGDGVNVNAPGGSVVLRGLSITGLGGTQGINLQAVERTRIESCVVSGMAQDGVHDAASGADVIVLDSIVRDNGNFGINMTVDGSIVLDHLRSEHNDTAGFHISPAASRASAHVTESVFVRNGSDGIVAESHVALARAIVGVDRSVMSGNTGSGFVASASSGGFVTATLAHNTLSDNGGDGVLVQSAGASEAVARIARSTMLANQNGVHTVDAIASTSANTMINELADLRCDGTGFLYTLGNNDAGGTTGCVQKVAGE
jgi:hypothetical protein